MKKILFIMCLCVLAVAHTSPAKAQGCYITPTNDYICDQQNPGASGHDVQRDLRNNVPGSGYVYQTNNARSEYDWVPRVLGNLEYVYEEPPPEQNEPSDWEGVQCEPGADPETAAMEHILKREGFVEQSYYDALGSEANCSYSYKAQVGDCGSSRPYCGDCAAGCLTVCVGHLVLESEMDTYAPCGTTFTEEHCTNLFENSDFPKYWNAAVQQADAMCLSDDEAACFLSTLPSVTFQHGTAWHTSSRKQNFMNDVWEPLKAGEFNRAARQLMESSWCSSGTEERCFDFVAAIQELAESGAEGCDGIANN